MEKHKKSIKPNEKTRESIIMIEKTGKPMTFGECPGTRRQPPFPLGAGASDPGSPGAHSAVVLGVRPLVKALNSDAFMRNRNQISQLCSGKMHFRVWGGGCLFLVPMKTCKVKIVPLVSINDSVLYSSHFCGTSSYFNYSTVGIFSEFLQKKSKAFLFRKIVITRWKVWWGTMLLASNVPGMESKFPQYTPGGCRSPAKRRRETDMCWGCFKQIPVKKDGSLGKHTYTYGQNKNTK